VFIDFLRLSRAHPVAVKVCRLLYDAVSAAQRLRIDVAERVKVEAPVHYAATSIRVELSRFGEVKELLGDYV